MAGLRGAAEWGEEEEEAEEKGDTQSLDLEGGHIVCLEDSKEVCIRLLGAGPFFVHLVHHVAKTGARSYTLSCQRPQAKVRREVVPTGAQVPVAVPWCC